MKHLFISVLLLLSLNIRAQIDNPAPQKLEYDGFVSLSGIDKATIYETAKTLFIKKFNKGNSPLRMNKNKGEIIGSGKNTFTVKTGKISKPNGTTLSYKITMNIDDDGYLIELSNFHFVGKKKQLMGGFLYQKESPNNDKQKKIESLLMPLAKQTSDQIQKDVHTFLLKYARNSIVQSVDVE